MMLLERSLLMSKYKVGDKVVLCSDVWQFKKDSIDFSKSLFGMVTNIIEVSKEHDGIWYILDGTSYGVREHCIDRKIDYTSCAVVDKLKRVEGLLLELEAQEEADAFKEQFSDIDRIWLNKNDKGYFTTIKLKDGRKATVRRFEGDEHNWREGMWNAYAKALKSDTDWNKNFLTNDYLNEAYKSYLRRSKLGR
jgi:hypothetical protein